MGLEAERWAHPELAFRNPERVSQVTLKLHRSHLENYADILPLQNWDISVIQVWMRCACCSDLTLQSIEFSLCLTVSAVTLSPSLLPHPHPRPSRFLSTQDCGEYCTVSIPFLSQPSLLPRHIGRIGPFNDSGSLMVTKVLETPFFHG